MSARVAYNYNFSWVAMLCTTGGYIYLSQWVTLGRQKLLKQWYFLKYHNFCKVSLSNIIKENIYSRFLSTETESGIK